MYVFEIYFACPESRKQNVLGFLYGYCRLNGFDNPLGHEAVYGVGISIDLRDSKYSSVNPDTLRNDIIYQVTKNYKTAHFCRYSLLDIRLMKKFCDTNRKYCFKTPKY